MNENENNRSNYELKSEAVEKLVDAQKGEVPEFSKEELEKYRSKKLAIPEWVKMIFIKAWFAGAACFFILWGLGIYLQSMLDMLFVAGAALGMVTDLLTNNVIRFIESVPGENDKWLLFPKSGMVSFFLNLVYALVLVGCVYAFYGIINRTIVAITGNVDTVPLGVEPVMYGLFTMGFDLLFVSCKNLMKQIIADAKNKL